MPPPVHLRTQIRQAVAALVTGLATTGARVHQSRMRPKGAAGLPCLLVVADDEDVTDYDMGDAQDRALDVLITGVAKTDDDLDDALDQIALEVETAIGISVTVGGRVLNMALTAVNVELDDGTDKPVGRIALRYRTSYQTAAGSPGAHL